MQKKFLLAAVFAASLGLTACSTAAAPDNIVTLQEANRDIITVTSSEKVKVTPDIAEIVLAVTTEAADAAACQEKNTADIASAVELLKGMGIAEKSIRTSDYRLNPRYDWSGNVQKLIGYEMRSALTVSDLPMDQVGSVLSGSVKVGINNIESISYLSSSYTESYQEALRLAVESSKAKADAMAAASSSSISSVASITEFDNRSEARYTDYSLMNKQTEESAAVAAGNAVEVMPGEIEVEAKITVEYYITPAGK